MSIISVGCKLRYDVTAPTTFLINIAAARTPQQKVIDERLQIMPNTPHEAFQLGFEDNRIFRLSLESGHLDLSYQAKVELQPAVEEPKVQETELPDLPPEALPYLNPSRYCESDRLVRWANQEFGDLLPGFSRVTAIGNWTYEHLIYQSGSTTSQSTACDVLIQRAGVCRDYAHLAIALCRALCIPARYVSGYAVGLEPPDFHGFFEAYLGSRWYLFDATRMAPVGGFVRIGTGRDAADTSFATLIGSAQLEEMSVWARDETTDASQNAPSQAAAISTV